MLGERLLHVPRQFEEVAHGVNSLLPPRKYRGLKSGHQVLVTNVFTHLVLSLSLVPIFCNKIW